MCAQSRMHIRFINALLFFFFFLVRRDLVKTNFIYEINILSKKIHVYCIELRVIAFQQFAKQVILLFRVIGVSTIIQLSK